MKLINQEYNPLSTSITSDYAYTSKGYPLVSLPKKHIQKVLNRESFTIFPHGIELRKTQRKKNYEISY